MGSSPIDRTTGDGSSEYRNSLWWIAVFLCPKEMLHTAVSAIWPQDSYRLRCFFIKDAAALLPKKIPDMPAGKIFVCAIGGPWPFDFFHFLRGRACCTGVGELFPGGCGQFCRQSLLRYNRDEEDLSCCRGFCSARGMPSGRPGGLIFQGAP